MANCGQLTWRARAIQSLNRPHDNIELWNFAKGWIHRFRETDENNVSEKLIYLWVTVNAWASKSVPDLSRNHEDAYLVHCMAKDKNLSDRFGSLYKVDAKFCELVNSFLEMAPIFQSLWLYNNGIEPWNLTEDRYKFIKKVAERDPYIVSTRNGQENRFPAFSPACALDHIQSDENIPADWPHLISMIYQVRCNLFHGGKNYNRDSDRTFIELAYKILWDVWKYELPQTLLPKKLPWSRILIRSGFLANSKGKLHISFQNEKKENIRFLKKIVELGRFGELVDDTFTPSNNEVEEDHWLSAVESCHGGAEGGAPDELPIMDTYMAGLVRWLNCLGIDTSYSCDGHGRNCARLECRDPNSASIAACILNLPGQQFEQRGRAIFQLPIAPSRTDSTIAAKNLLDIAEWLHANQNQLYSSVRLLKSVRPLRLSLSNFNRPTRRTPNQRIR
ncbi:hypothetical protein H4684_001480 [Desulfomicrobium macestii]|uniref:Apea-like HEPN domain-containing protein n=1 Tax=Desulfomicrobium macestii TaxID=90731 RepID=A0ABR9H2B0_9BACT|nr:hypothetical protein [Desulfomicrobium macestii]MBE1424841.1 hypothetical protein [Desulfomicrobium macestii]